MAAEPAICGTCYSGLAYVTTWNQPENDVTDRLAGRLPLVRGVALLHFNVDTVAQSLIHALKYHNRPEVGSQLGAELGRKLRQLPNMGDVRGIVPVPIHPARRAQRGYNQAEHIAEGLSATMEVPVYPDALVRTSFKGSQTKLTKLERIENVAASFQIGVGNFAGRHLLLVDDVITTGSTLDFCGDLLVKRHPGLRLSVATLAVAQLTG